LNLDPPKPGAVIRYAYLFQHESRAGKLDAGKDRPALVMTLATIKNGGATHVLVAAITHTPQSDTDGLEISAAVKAKLGLDSDRSWILLTEANSFRWPGPDIRPVPGRGDTYLYGSVPRPLLRRAVRLFLSNRGRQLGEISQRST
jgi:hypothetical protein